ncbi:DUF2303 family protein [Telmatospirillum sp.]|uniref:DUF2303 family protein n=1 Tax=Telmatospirillum sp. TaxID=2079197 RepID=UPI0028439BAD|nr:DUF2303 family protein [Telmatospirillum sp.]MDR3438986.1 DUF2303 family protein [Telmatospirillum sp.]
MPEEVSNVAETVADLVKTLHTPQIMTLVSPEGISVPVAALPSTDGISLTSVKGYFDEYRGCPERREGTAVMLTLDSLIDHVNRFKNPNTALFADSDKNRPLLIAVIDYHDRVNVSDANTPDAAAQPHFGRHRCLHQFPLSDEWTAWNRTSAKPMSQVDFSLFLEERIVDVLPVPTLGDGDLSKSDQELQRIVNLLKGKFAGPEDLMTLSRGLAIHESSKVLQAVNLSSGESHVVFETEHQDEAGEKLSVPNLFCIGIPVFEGGDAYRVLVRLRYRKQSGGLIWTYELYRQDRVFKDALDGACAKAAEKTALPLFVGRPESTSI